MKHFLWAQNKLVKAFLGERGGPCLEMTHGTGLEVGGSPKGGCGSLNAYLPVGHITLSKSHFLGEGIKCVYLPEKRGRVHASPWGTSGPGEHTHVQNPKASGGTQNSTVCHMLAFNTFPGPVKTQKK